MRTANTSALSATNIVLPSTPYATLVRRPLPSYTTFVSVGPKGGSQCMYRTLLGCRAAGAPPRPAFAAPRPARPAGSVPLAAKTDCRYTIPGPTGFHWRLRFPVSEADCVAPRPNPAGASSSPTSPSRSGVRPSSATIFPLASHNWSIEPKLDVGTRYENGSAMRLTRKYAPSGDASTDRIMAGAPILRTARDLTSTWASWPVV